jgi:hypothetical protein
MFKDADTFSSKCSTHYRRIEELAASVYPESRQPSSVSRSKRKASELNENNQPEEEDEMCQFRRIRLRSIRIVEHIHKTTALILTGANEPEIGKDNNQPTTCTRCFTQRALLWCREPEGHVICNACGGSARSITSEKGLLEQLFVRGEGEYYCYFGLNCDKGGVVNGQRRMFKRNCDYRYVFFYILLAKVIY